MKFTLLTHAREFGKRSNSGRLVLEGLGPAAEQVRWDRTHPPAQLLADIAAGGVALVYPGNAAASVPPSHIAQFLLIDGTWLSARWIYQRSAYLRDLPRVSLQPGAASQYNLRPNQKAGCLCTAECVIEILTQLGHHAEAEQLRARFLAFLKPPSRPPLTPAFT